MGDVIKTLISTQIKAFEQGAFQDFCLAFLPLYDSNLVGLERHGGTADGKTRAGTPDLIKTDVDGTQICVQCSVEKDYWSKPGNIDEWKPIKDILKCTGNVPKIKEIILCASQEIPTTQPNVKSEIIRHAQSITSAIIQQILSISNFEESIRNDIYKYTNIIERFFPDLHDYLQASLHKGIAETTLDYYKRYPIPLESIELIVKKHFESEKIDPTALELEISEIAKSRFLRSRVPDVQPIQRQSATDFILGHKFDGAIYCVLGVPKIGKTSWVSQICHEMKNADFEVIWFDAPYEHSSHEDFCRDFKRIVIEKMSGAEIANQFVDKKVGIVELESFLRKSTPDKKYLFIIDNAEKLIPDGISCLKAFLTILKNSSAGKKWGIILISNNKLASYIGNIATEIQCPSWNHDEVLQLLKTLKIDIRDDITKYAELLTINSGGHPLVARSLARQAPRIIDLLPLKPKTVPLYDEDLTTEIKEFLFNDLLKDSDHRDLVLRLSTLFSRFDSVLVEFISSQITPQLRTPVKLMFENLKYMVIEGDNQIGYQIAFVFKQVAADYLTDKEKREIYDKVGSYLMTPRNKTINADDAINAIYYAIAAGKLMNALSWTTLLLHHSKDFNKEQIKYLLNRLDIILALNFPKESVEKLSYFIALLIMSVKYGKVDENKKANEILLKLLNNPLDPKDIPKEMPLSYEQMYTILSIYTVFNFVQLKEINAALDLINKQEAKPLIDVLRKTHNIDVLSLLISMGTLDHFPKNLIKNLIMNATVEDDDLLGVLAQCFCDLGVIAHKEKNRISLVGILNEEISKEVRLGELLGKIAIAQYELDSRNAKESLKITDEVFHDTKAMGIRSKKFLQKLLFLKGDAFYQLKDFEEAYKEYTSCLSLTKEQDSFEYGWLNYRLGLSTIDYYEALSCLKKASLCFERTRYLNLKARSDGEAAAALYQSGRVEEAIDLLFGIVDGYYLKNIQEFGPAATIAVATSTRLLSELTKQPLYEFPESGRISPRLEKRVFSEVLDLAKPEPGVSTVYYFYGEIYEFLGEEQKALKCFKTSLEGTERIKEDKLSKAMAAKSLFSLFIRMGMEKESCEIIDRLLIISHEIESNIKNFGITFIFGMLESLLAKKELSYDQYLNILNYIEQHIKATPAEPQKDRWLAEIYKRKAGSEGSTEDYDPDLLLTAYKYAKEARNYGVMIATAHQLGFRYISKVSSFRELAEIQLSMIFAICQGGEDIENLEIAGINLIKLWSVITFKHLRESDFPYLENLRDRAKNIKANTPEELHAPLMILFLLNVNGVGQNEEYKKAVQWAKSKLIGKSDKIPTDDYNYIKSLIE